MEDVTLTDVLVCAGRTKLIDDSKSPNPRFRGLVHGTAVIVREEGLRGVYRGLFPVVRLSPFLPLLSLVLPSICVYACTADVLPAYM